MHDAASKSHWSAQNINVRQLIRITVAHSFLSQIPLVISPYVNVPQPVTLPANYAALPRALPPSSAAMYGEVKAIISSVEEQQKAVARQQEEANAAVARWEAKMKDSELMAARQIGPGYLDTGVHMLEPTNKHLEVLAESLKTQAQISQAEPAPPAYSVPHTLSAIPRDSSTPIQPQATSSYAIPSAHMPQIPPQQIGTTAAPYSRPVSTVPSQFGYASVQNPYEFQRLPHQIDLPASSSHAASVYSDSSSYYGRPDLAQPDPMTLSQQAPPPLNRQVSAAHSVHGGPSSPLGPPLPPKPPYQLIHRPLNLATIRRPTMSEFPWAAAAAFAARSISGMGFGGPPPNQFTPQGPLKSFQSSSDSSRDVSSLYESSSNRKSSLPRLDSYRGHDYSIGSLDAKLNEYLGRTSATPDSTSQNVSDSLYSRPKLGALPENLEDPVLKYLKPRDTELEKLIDLDDENPVPITFAQESQSKSLIDTEVPEIQSYDEMPDYMRPTDHVVSYDAASSDSALAAKFKLGANYLDGDVSDLHDLKSSPAPPMTTTSFPPPLVANYDDDDDNDNDYDDDDFSALMAPQSSAALMKASSSVATPVQEEKDSLDAATQDTPKSEKPLPELNAGDEDYLSDNGPVTDPLSASAHPLETAESDDEDDEEAINEMLKKLQQEIDEEEKAASRAKREARRKAVQSQSQPVSEIIEGEDTVKDIAKETTEDIEEPSETTPELAKHENTLEKVTEAASQSLEEQIEEQPSQHVLESNSDEPILDTKADESSTVALPQTSFEPVIDSVPPSVHETLTEESVSPDTDSSLEEAHGIYQIAESSSVPDIDTAESKAGEPGLETTSYYSEAPPSEDYGVREIASEPLVTEEGSKTEIVPENMSEVHAIETLGKYDDVGRAKNYDTIELNEFSQQSQRMPLEEPESKAETAITEMDLVHHNELPQVPKGMEEVESHSVEEDLEPKSEMMDILEPASANEHMTAELEAAPSKSALVPSPENAEQPAEHIQEGSRQDFMAYESEQIANEWGTVGAYDTPYTSSSSGGEHVTDHFGVPAEIPVPDTAVSSLIPIEQAENIESKDVEPLDTLSIPEPNSSPREVTGSIDSLMPEPVKSSNDEDHGTDALEVERETLDNIHATSSQEVPPAVTEQHIPALNEAETEHIQNNDVPGSTNVGHEVTESDGVSEDENLRAVIDSADEEERTIPTEKVAVNTAQSDDLPAAILAESNEQDKHQSGNIEVTPQSKEYSESVVERDLTNSMGKEADSNSSSAEHSASRLIGAFESEEVGSDNSEHETVVPEEVRSESPEDPTYNPVTEEGYVDVEAPADSQEAANDGAASPSSAFEEIQS
ncbi:uncharacterized protein V1516DRAFT_710480 [Lipomyces oligophaga]|uniref:uncharacterized protein n=1 Tax=Lipomyces oligophaga TaxID=45792 RepID=UPI0034CEEA81